MTSILLGMFFASLGFSQSLFNDLKIHGFLSQGFLQTTKNNYFMETKNGNLEYNEAAINFSIQINAKLRGGMQLLSRDFGSDGNNETILDWGYLDYHWKDELGIRAGKIKRPNGLYNAGRDIDALRTFVMLPQSVYDESMREITLSFQGASIYGNLSLKALGNLDYEAYYGISNMDYDMAFTRKLMENAIVQIEADLFRNLTMAGALPPGASLSHRVVNPSIRMKNSEGISVFWNTPVTNLRFGVSRMMLKVNHSATIDFSALMEGRNILGITIPYASCVNYKAMDTFSGEYIWKNLTLAGEFYYTDGEAKSEGRVVKTMKNEAYYGQAAYRLSPKWEAGTYYSVHYINSDDKEGKQLKSIGEPEYLAWQKDACFALRFDIANNWLVKGEVHLINGTSLADQSLNTDGTEKNWRLFALKTSFTF